MAIIFLWLGAGLAFAYLMQIATDRPGTGHWQRSIVKTGATLGLVAAGVAAEAPGLIVIGVGLGAAGDFCLSRPGQTTFLAGMAAFAAGHLAYLAAFWTRAAQLGVTHPTTLQIAVIALLGLAVLALGLWLSSKAGPLRLPVLAYALVIGLMAATALILPANPGDRTIQTGVALFLLSDTLLAFRLFASPASAKRPLDLAVWPAYWLGQALILVGTAIYWDFPKG